MEFLVRVQNVLELFAFVSNGIRLPRPLVRCQQAYRIAPDEFV
jgi:hypothetical protein